MIRPSTHTLTQIIRLRTHAHITPNFSHFGIGSNSLARITWIENDSNDLLGYNRNVCRRWFIIDRMFLMVLLLFLIRPILLNHTRTHIHFIRKKKKNQKFESVKSNIWFIPFVSFLFFVIKKIHFCFVFRLQKWAHAMRDTHINIYSSTSTLVRVQQVNYVTVSIGNGCAIRNVIDLTIERARVVTYSTRP